MSYSFPEFEQLAYAGGKPGCTGRLRVAQEDFQVDEQLSFVPDGSGEHVFLQICKRNLNTVDVVNTLCRFADVKQVDVGYAGLKDKYAVTTQWFSVKLAGKSEPDWQKLNDSQLSVISITRHGKKLKTGSLTGNQFRILIRDLAGECDAIEDKLGQISQQGVPNYFAEQRFGYEGNNLVRARQWFNRETKVKDRNKRSIYLSAARSWLFNLVLSARVEDRTWNLLQNGDVAMLSGSRSFFKVDVADNEIQRRLTEKDISPSAPLWGKGELATEGKIRETEQKCLLTQKLLCNGLEQAGMKQERRATILYPQKLIWDYKKNEQTLLLVFFLPRGCYATALIRELLFITGS